MKNKPRQSSGKDITDQWDGMTFMERLKIIMDHASLLLAQGLIEPREIALAEAMSESAQEYIVGREDHPIFTGIHLKKEVAAQLHRDKFEAALEAVFK